MRRKNRIKSLFCLLGCGGLLTVNGQETGEGSWKIKGFAETYHALRIESPNDWMSSRTRFRGEVTHDMGRSSLFVSFNAVYHALLKDRTGFELREAYLDYRAKHWGGTCRQTACHLGIGRRSTYYRPCLADGHDRVSDTRL